MTGSITLTALLLCCSVGIVLIEARSTKESVCQKNMCLKKHEMCEVVDDKPVCVKRCKTCNADEMKPVCGFDGKSYKNKCFLHEVECMEETFIGVECQGLCPCDPAEVVALDPKLVHRLQKLRLQVRREHHLEKELKREAESSTVAFHKHKEAGERKVYLMKEKARIEGKLRRKIKKWHRLERKMKKSQLSKKEGQHAEEELQRRITKMKDSSIVKSGTCTPEKLNDLPSRLIDWFHVLRSNAARHSKNGKPLKQMKFMDEKLRAIYVKLSCGKSGDDPFETEVMCLEPLNWMFNHLDINQDNQLSANELTDFTGNQAETCMKPFLTSCDFNFNSTIERGEFCKCLCVEPTCTKAVENVPTVLKDGKPLPASGYFVPRCDEDGFFVSQQCYKGECWCVDRNGAEITSTRKTGETVCGDNTLSKEEAELNIQKKLVKSS